MATPGSRQQLLQQLAKLDLLGPLNAEQVEKFILARGKLLEELQPLLESGGTLAADEQAWLASAKQVALRVQRDAEAQLQSLAQQLQLVQEAARLPQAAEGGNTGHIVNRVG
jgi:hypothetical protein